MEKKPSDKKKTDKKKEHHSHHEKSKDPSEASKSSEGDFTISKGTFVQYREGLIERDYKIGDVIGSGAFAQVRKVIAKNGGHVRALKVIKKQKGQAAARLHLEVEILKKLVHPNIMQIFEFYEDKKTFYIITELCEGGELFDKIIELGSFGEREAAKVMYQLLSAISYIHSNHIVHRDLKPENILLDTKKDFVIKIIDWGTARFFDKSKKMNHISGTPYYIAPEVLNKKYDEKCDVWSCGIILYILLCGYPPFNADSDDEILEKIKEGKFQFPAEEWDSVSKEAKEFITKLLTKDPSKRPSAAEALNDAWITTNKNTKVSSKLSSKCMENMRNFHTERKLQQASLTYIANNLLTKDEKNELLELFHSFDTNGDGVLSKEEIINGYKQYMPFDNVEEMVEEIFNNIDTDKNGTIDYNEFVVASIGKQKLLNNARLEETFKMFDKDGNGSISREEIKMALGNSMDEKTLEDLIKEVDTNGDGEISLKEFKDMMISLFGK
ncbi:MAG: protein kinase [archaeon]|nr:protein kinase [archaeon]